MKLDMDSNDVLDAYLLTIMGEPIMVETFGENGMSMEDTGGVKTGREFSLAATMIAEGTTDTVTAPSSVMKTYQIGIIIYVADKQRSAKKKRELVQLTSVVTNTMALLKYRRDPDPTRAAWYKSDFLQPLNVRYRKMENHQQAVAVVNLYGRRRVS